MVDSLARLSLRHYALNEYQKKQEISLKVMSMNGVVILVSGKIDCSIDGMRHIISMGDVIKLSENQCLSGTVLQTAKIAIVDFTNDEMMSLPILFHIDIQRDFITMLTKLKYSWLQADNNHHLESTGLFLQILAYLDSHNVENSSHYIKQIKKYIIDHFNEKITIKRMAQDLGVNRVYCGAIFKKEVGMTINNYINEVRIKEAAAMLIHSERANLTEISKACGFKNLSYFSRLFKEYTNVSPSQYHQVVQV